MTLNKLKGFETTQDAKAFGKAIEARVIGGQSLELDTAANNAPKKVFAAA